MHRKYESRFHKSSGLLKPFIVPTILPPLIDKVFAPSKRQSSRLRSRNVLRPRNTDRRTCLGEFHGDRGHCARHRDRDYE